MKRYLTMIAAVVFVALATVPAFAKGPPSKATISGPGLPGTVEITDPALLNALSFFQFENVNENNRHGIAAPAHPGAAYLITRYVENPDRSFRPWDELHYYPADNRGYVFLDGLIGDSYTEFDGRWYQASPEGDAAMKQLLAQHGVSLLPATGKTLPFHWWLLTLGGSLLVLGRAGAAAARRKQRI